MLFQDAAPSSTVNKFLNYLGNTPWALWATFSRCSAAISTADGSQLSAGVIQIRNQKSKIVLTVERYSP
jgi:hypothetical protein